MLLQFNHLLSNEEISELFPTQSDKHETIIANLQAEVLEIFFPIGYLSNNNISMADGIEKPTPG